MEKEEEKEGDLLIRTYQRDHRDTLRMYKRQSYRNILCLNSRTQETTSKSNRRISKQ